MNSYPSGRGFRRFGPEHFDGAGKLEPGGLWTTDVRVALYPLDKYGLFDPTIIDLQGLEHGIIVRWVGSDYAVYWCWCHEKHPVIHAATRLGKFLPAAEYESEQLELAHREFQVAQASRRDALIHELVALDVTTAEATREHAEQQPGARQRDLAQLRRTNAVGCPS